LLFELSIDYIINQNNLDHPVVLKKSRTGTSFISQELGDNFYPTHEPGFHVPFNKIDILSTSKIADYTLMKVVKIKLLLIKLLKVYLR